MTREQKQELETLALRVREHIIRMATDGGCPRCTVRWRSWDFSSASD